jgi:hypothetical protein
MLHDRSLLCTESKGQITLREQGSEMDSGVGMTFPFKHGPGRLAVLRSFLRSAPLREHNAQVRHSTSRISASSGRLVRLRNVLECRFDVVKTGCV